MTTDWECPRCAGCSDAAAEDAGFLPDDPDATCVACGGHLPEITRLRLQARALVAKLERHGGTLSTISTSRGKAIPVRRVNSAAGILSKRATARRIGIGRDTVTRLVEAGLLVPIPKGARTGFRTVDVERLVAQGYSLPDAEAPARPRGKRRRATSPGSPTAQSIGDLPY